MRRGESVVQPHGWHTQALLLSREAVRTIALTRFLVNSMLGPRTRQNQGLKIPALCKKYTCATSAMRSLKLFRKL